MSPEQPSNQTEILQPPIISPETTRDSVESLYEQALSFVETHRTIFEHCARGAITIESSPKGLNTFAFNLQTNTIYIHPMFYKELGLSEERTVFATLHEIEHFLEKKQVLARRDGIVRYKEYIEKIKRSRAFALTDNCVADIYVNRSVIHKTNEQMANLERGMYTEVLFKDRDFTTSPRHIQFAQALLRESRVPDEVCIVDNEVRKKLDYIKNLRGKSGQLFMERLTHPNTAVVDRWDLQDKIIMPIIEELKAQDVEEEVEKRKQQKKDKNQNASPQDSQDKKENLESNSENSDEKPKDNLDNDSKNTDKSASSGTPEPNENDEENDDTVFDPDEFWKNEYDEADKRTPNAQSVEDIEKEIKEYEDFLKGNKQAEEQIQDTLDKEYAESIGVKKEDLQAYRKTVTELEKIINPETNRGVIYELRDIWKRIIAHRRKKTLVPRYPVEDGDELVEPAELVAAVKSGDIHPKVWKIDEIKEKKDTKYGEVEITFVCDRSESMLDYGKIIEQRKAMILAMESLKELSVLCKKEKMNLRTPLEVRHEIFTFQSNDAQDTTPIKKMSPESTEQERVNAAAFLATVSGSTTDYASLSAIYTGMTKNTFEKIKSGELKKIVFVLTDGASNSQILVNQQLQLLRGSGVFVFGIGITKSGLPTLTTYNPDAQLVEQSSSLPVVIGGLLKEHLSDM